MGEGNDILNVVVVRNPAAKTVPDTVIPAPIVPGSAVCAFRFV
jgi:hypothetical protein